MNGKKKFLYYMVCLYIIILPLQIEIIKIKGISLKGDMFLAIIGILYLLNIIFIRESREGFISGIGKFFIDPLTLFMIILLGLMVYSRAYALDKSIALREAIRFASYIALYFIIKNEFNEERYINGIIRSLIIACVFPTVYGIIQFVTGVELPKNFVFKGSMDLYRITAGMGNPNTYGGFIILLIFPMIMLFIKEKHIVKKTFYGLIWILLFVNMIMTFSRNAWSAFVVGLVVLAFAYSWKLIIALGGIGGIAFFIPAINERVRQFTDLSQNETRYKIWGAASKVIKDHFLKGVGNGNFPKYFEIYSKKYPQYLCSGHTTYQSHNSYIKIFSELGIIGLVPFLGILLCALAKIRKVIVGKSDYKMFYIGVMAAFIAFLYMNLFDDLFFVPKATTYFWIMLALSDSINNIRRKGINLRFY